MENRIAFHFHPYKIEDHLHVVEKTEGNIRRCYLEGIASGIKKDEHGERMTERCIKSFMDQANTGDILLYPDLHGFKATEDIGILKSAEILPEGDWHISCMLYDESDGIDTASVQSAQKLWKQVNGLPPYTRPRVKGFSIEGYVPDGGIVNMNTTGQRVLDNVSLDGVVVVPRPAYKDSIAHAVYKALGVNAPWQIENFQNSIRSKLRDKLVSDEIKDTYFRRKYQIEDIFQDQINDIMVSQVVNKEELLGIAFDEFKALMMELILQSEDAFDCEQLEEVTMSRKRELLLNIRKNLNAIVAIRGEINEN